jgi:type II secretory pathway component PulF
MRLTLQQKEQFFHELSGGLVAGSTFRQVMERGSKRRTRARSAVSKALVESLEVSDGTAASAFALVPEVFDDLDISMVRAGESAGKLDEVARTLSDYYRTLDRARQSVVKQLVYPIFLLHFGIFVLAAPSAINGGFDAWLKEVAISLGIAYLILGSLALISWWVAGRLDSSPTLERVVRIVPGIGGLRKALIASRFSMVLAMLVRAGLGAINGFQQAGVASGSALYRAGAERVAESVRGGDSLEAAVNDAGCFPEGIRDAVTSAESTGRLDTELSRVAAIYQESFATKLEALAVWIPRFIYLAVILLLAFKIIEVAQGYFAGFSQVLE